jgi:hypothetical protein
MGRPKQSELHDTFDSVLMDLPEAARWREWMGRVEAVIFAAQNRCRAKRSPGWLARPAILTI